MIVNKYFEYFLVMECAFGVTDFFDLLDEGFDFLDVRFPFGTFLQMIRKFHQDFLKKILPVIDITRLEGSLDDYVKEMGIQKTDGYSSVQACLPFDDLIQFFGTDHMALMHQRITWNIEGVPFELTDNYFDGELMTITNPRRMEIASAGEEQNSSDS